MYHEVERYESEKYPGLVAVAIADDWHDNPLSWIGVKEVTSKQHSYWLDDARRVEDARMITCPECEGGGMVADDEWCPRCEGIRETPAKSEAEWCADYGVAAAVPVSYGDEWIREEDWGEECSSIFYLPKDESCEWSAEDIRFSISDLRTAIQEGFYFVKVEVDPDSDLPDDVVPTGCDLDGVGGILGFDGYQEAATELLAQAEVEVEGELARRLEWAKRDVVTK